MNQNIFAQSMVRLQLPEHFGRSISLSGFTVSADDDGCVTVPAHLAAELRSHGLTDAPVGAVAAPNGKAKK